MNLNTLKQKPEYEIGGTIFELMRFMCQHSKGEDTFWANNDEILCRTESEANMLAELLELCGCDCVNTGWYDPEEDAKENTIFDDTGWWYVSIG